MTEILSSGDLLRRAADEYGIRECGLLDEELRAIRHAFNDRRDLTIGLAEATTEPPWEDEGVHERVMLLCMAAAVLRDRELHQQGGLK